MSDNTHPQLAGQAALPYLNRFLDPTSSVLLDLVVTTVYLFEYVYTLHSTVYIYQKYSEI